MAIHQAVNDRDKELKEEEDSFHLRHDKSLLMKNQDAEVKRETKRVR